ncbi:MAG: hypothetical protein JO126_00425 [Alphaproteobacteria bacterium]|nr:hypothetical protein [Alphaproteobacteria bacterium]MBV8547906.1 hypothetical protein [Alphaproteobacteria bacterium]
MKGIDLVQVAALALCVAAGAVGAVGLCSLVHYGAMHLGMYSLGQAMLTNHLVSGPIATLGGLGGIALALAGVDALSRLQR